MLKACPSPDQLRRLLSDQLGEIQENTIGDHVERCIRCQESLERLTDDVVRPERLPSSIGLSEDLVELEVDPGFLHALKSVPPCDVLSGLDLERSNPSMPHPFADVSPVDRCEPDGYELLAELGRGGMGIVYKARHRRLDRAVALKMILAGAHASPRDLDRFRREAEAIARLQHPNIVQIHEIGQHAGRPYLALEFVEGESLARHLSGTPLPARRSAELVETLGRAIHAAHELGIIHRDLKPANVLLTDSGTPKITDFGLAKRLDGEAAFPTLTEQFLGTPSYMAPEQAVRSDPAPPGVGTRPEWPRRWISTAWARSSTSC